MAERDDSTKDTGPRILNTQTYSVAVCLAYARAFDRGMQIDLAELGTELDAARDAHARCLRASQLPVRGATVTGLEHAQIRRLQGANKVPKTFVA